MSDISGFRSARRKLEEAAAELIWKAQTLEAGAPAWKMRELLAQAREYGRAFNRIETMRGK
jgi:hypothetical protein